jgi:hypothetical protein
MVPRLTLSSSRHSGGKMTREGTEVFYFEDAVKNVRRQREMKPEEITNLLHFR